MLFNLLSVRSRTALLVLPMRTITQGSAAHFPPEDKVASRAKKYAKRTRGDIFTPDSKEAQAIKKEKQEKREAKEERIYREQVGYHMVEDEAIEEEEASELEEVYVPRQPIKFDKTGKYLIYRSQEDKD